MSTYQGSKKPWPTSLSDAATRVEQELRQLINAVDEDVVPEVRKHGSAALRMLASKIDHLAEHMEDARKRSSPPPPPPQGRA